MDFVAGCLGGAAGVLVGHPLDTVKVHLQTQDPRNPKYKGILHCIKTIVMEERIRGLYRGMSSPLAGISFVNAIVFGIYGNVQRATDDPNSLYSHFLAGSMAGFFQAVVCAPMELAKTRVQLQHESSKFPQHKGPYECIKHILRTEGIRGAFKGLTITAARDVPGFAAYFVSYEYIMSLSAKPHVYHTLFAGGMAGIFSWLACYPIDVIKTSIQADGGRAAPVYKNSMDCARKGYQQDGFNFFFRGLNSTLVRAFPMNAACFLVVSWFMQLTQDTSLDVLVHPSEPLTVQPSKIDQPLTYTQPTTNADHKELRNRRQFMSRSLKVLTALDEAISDSDAEQLASEFYPVSKEEYYVFEEEHLPQL